MFVYLGVMPWCTCRGQRATCRNPLLFSSLSGDETQEPLPLSYLVYFRKLLMRTLSVQVHVLLCYYKSDVTYELLRTPLLECSLSFIVHSHFRGKQPSSDIVTCSASCPLLTYLPCSLSLWPPMTVALHLVPLLRSCVLLVQTIGLCEVTLRSTCPVLLPWPVLCGFLSIHCALLKFSQGIS